MYVPTYVAALRTTTIKSIKESHATNSHTELTSDAIEEGRRKVSRELRPTMICLCKYKFSRGRLWTDKEFSMATVCVGDISA